MTIDERQFAKDLADLVRLGVYAERERCIEVARSTARAVSKGNYGRLSVEQIGEKIAEEILKG